MRIIGPHHGVGVYGHIVTELLDHGAELDIVLDVPVAAMQSDIVLALQLRPDPLLTVERA